MRSWLIKLSRTRITGIHLVLDRGHSQQIFNITDKKKPELLRHEMLTEQVDIVPVSLNEKNGMRGIRERFLAHFL